MFHYTVRYVQDNKVTVVNCYKSLTMANFVCRKHLNEGAAEAIIIVEKIEKEKDDDPSFYEINV